MASFGWKRKIGSSVNKSVTKTFTNDSKDDLENEDDSIDWLTLVPKRKIICLEDARAKSARLVQEGTLLAESERYWEAIKKWDEAVQLTPDDAKIYEMKAQALLILCEVYPALVMAEKAVSMEPTWWIGYQTLGRIHLGIGEVKMALKCFARALHIRPDDQELWEEDFHWACSLLIRKKASELSNTVASSDSHSSNSVTITELDTNVEAKESSSSERKNKLTVASLTAVDLKLCENVPSDENQPLCLPRNYVLMRDT